MYIYQNQNPDGKITGDCVTRAVSLAQGISWDEAYLALMLAGLFAHDRADKGYVWIDYLTRHGYRRHIIPNTCPDCYSVREFCIDHPKGTYILGTGSHVVTVIDGNYYDTWDSGAEIPIFYMEKQQNGI